MIRNKRLTIGITMGDPSGIGPEIILKSFSESSVKKKRILVIGDFNIMQAAHSILKIKSFELKRVRSVTECVFNENTLNILDLPLINMKEFQPGKVQEPLAMQLLNVLEKLLIWSKIKKLMQ
jgi:4-hydroxythreonine-4-phosphate dehydrogenase